MRGQAPLTPAEIIDAELVRLADCQVSEDVIAIAASLGQLSLTIGESVAETFQHTVESKQRGFFGTDTPPSREIRQRLLNDEILSPREVRLFEEVGDAVHSLLLRQCNDGDDMSGAKAVVSNYFAAAEDIHAMRAKRRDMSKVLDLDKKIVDFFAIALGRQNDGLLVREGEIREAINPALTLSERLKNDEVKDPDEVFGYTIDTNISLLKALAVAQFIGATRRLPTSKASRNDTEVFRADYLLGYINDKPGLLTSVDSLYFADHIKGIFKRRLPEDLDSVRKDLIEAQRIYALVNLYEASQNLVLAHGEAEKHSPIFESVDKAQSLTDIAVKKVEELLQAAERDHFSKENLTQQDILAVLAVERFIYVEWAVSNGITDAVDMEKEVQASKFHTSINTLALQLGLEELEAATAPLIERLETFNSSYRTSATEIRELEGGKQLRRLLEEWREPGTNKCLFSREDAQTLAGIALKVAKDPGLKEHFLADLGAARDAWSGLDFLRVRVPSGKIIAAIDTLTELHEAASEAKLNNEALQPLWELITSSAELPTHEEGILPDPDTPIQHATDNTLLHQETVEGLPEDVKAFLDEVSAVLPIKAFPPDTTAEFMEHVFRSQIKEWSGVRVEWQRISSLHELHVRLQAQGIKTTLYLLERSAWHQLPHFVIEAERKGKKAVVVESPIYANATYMLKGDNWTEAVQVFRKNARKEFGATQKVHAASSSAEEHRTKLFESITSLV